MRSPILFFSMLLLISCSSADRKSTTPETANKVNKALTQTEKTTAKPPAKSCKYDTDCIVQNSCQANKCKFGGGDCRFRSDCRTSGQCVSGQCEYQ